MLSIQLKSHAGGGGLLCKGQLVVIKHKLLIKVDRMFKYIVFHEVVGIQSRTYIHVNNRQLLVNIYMIHYIHAFIL